MAVIDLVKWDGNPNILAWKFHSEELSTWTQLIVNETQEAYLVKSGVYQGPFGAGRHTLSTENIPYLSKLINLPFGGKSPFTAEVWFVNLATNLSIKWGTPDPIQLNDPKYQIMVPVRAFGQYGIRISDPKKFLLKWVGTLKVFDAYTLSDYFKGVFATKIKTGIANAIIKQGISVLEVSTQLDALSDMLKQSLGAEMAEYGIGLAQLNINSINVPEDDTAVVTLKKALAKRAEMGLLGYTYQQERSFDVMQTAAGNEGTPGTLMGAGMGMGMGVGIGVPMGNAFAQIAPQVQGGSAPPSPQSQTTATIQSQVMCAKCNAVNQAGARFCATCGGGISIPSNPSNLICTKCNAAIAKDSKFCPECGTKTVASCKKCGCEISVGTKFCNNCGEPQ